MRETTTVTGLVITTPRHLVTQDGLPITSFRLACAHRKFDSMQNKWVDGNTNWYTITAFRTLAINMAGSVNKGERIVVMGELLVREWDNGERAGTIVEIEAKAVGHDLNWCTSAYTRTPLTTSDREDTFTVEAPAPVVEAPYEY